MVAMRFFNTSGPVIAADHYCVPPLERLNLREVLRLVGQKRYFVLHAPRQTGKTSILLALRDLLNGGAAGDYRCVYANFEVAQAAREDVEGAMRAMLGHLANRALLLGDGFLDGIWPDILAKFGPFGALEAALTRWSVASPAPLVLLIDEIDSLVGDTLVSVLRQLRAGHDRRPTSFPQSVVLCGLRDVREYRIQASSEKEMVLGGSAFNIKAKSLRLGDFPEAEVRTLLDQHTKETGQVFTPEAINLLHEQTQGQPWLVNALCYQACFESEAARDHNRPIAATDIRDAREQLILRRDTHLDQLVDKLREDRVRRVIEPLLSGADRRDFSGQDLEYVRDLGLVARDDPLRIANPIYAEVVPRELNYAVQAGLVEDPAWYVDAGGGLNVDRLLAAFQAFFREHSEHWLGRFDYEEAGPQLLLQAFLQRVVNSGGRIEREYGLGRRRTDLLIVWPQGEDSPEREGKFVIECKVLREGGRSLDATIQEGLEQTVAYMDRCESRAGHLVVFDRSEKKPWTEKLFRREQSAGGEAPERKRTITVWGM